MIPEKIKTRLRDPRKKQVADLNILIVTFIEDSVYFYYAPQLDIYGYGQTENEAKESLQEALREFFRYTVHERTLQSELMRLGWKFQKQTKSFTPPGFAQLLLLNADLKGIVESKSFTKTHYNIQIPVF